MFSFFVLVFTVLLGDCAENLVISQERRFTIDWKNNQFLKDGVPFRYISGSMHYFRVPRPYWRDRMRKMRAAGLNTLCTYIEWSLHEPLPGSYDFSGDKDVVEYVKMAAEEGLFVILRPGPYICAERDLGGFPVWLYHINPNMVLRTRDPVYTAYVNRWLSVLMPKLQPLLYGNGGPVILLQVENEYGSYYVTAGDELGIATCDRFYTTSLRDVFYSYVLDSAVLFTTDGFNSTYLVCGPIPGTFATIDFRPGDVGVPEAFEPLRMIQRCGPLVNSEFYPGRLTNWGDPEKGGVSLNITTLVEATRQLLQIGASFNFYMFCGGTSFGFTNGANNVKEANSTIVHFKPQVTSYDNDVPISESGNLTEKYFALQSVISEFVLLPNIPITSSSPASYGPVQLEHKKALFDSKVGIPYGQAILPRTFEDLGLYQGLLWYETVLPSWYEGPGLLEANNTHDRAIVLMNKKIKGILSRMENRYAINIQGKAGQTLGILVENQGHINYANMHDIKGLPKNVTLDGVTLTGWNHVGYPLDNVFHIARAPTTRKVEYPAFYAGSFNITGKPQDTFVDMRGWTKGVLYVNGHNLGRYWPVEGPQITLYLPAPFLKDHNTVLVLELESAPYNRTIKLVDAPVWSKGQDSDS